MRTNLIKIAQYAPGDDGEGSVSPLRLSRDGDVPVPVAAHALQAMLATSFERVSAEDPKFSPAVRLGMLVGGSIGAWGVLLGAISALR